MLEIIDRFSVISLSTKRKSKLIFHLSDSLLRQEFVNL